MPELIVFLRSREISRTPVMLSQLAIGRDHTCDVQIDNPAVSRTHAVLAYRDGAFWIRDAESENGITVNGRPVEEAELKFGDIVGISKFKVHFSQDGGVPPEMLEAPNQAVGPGGASVVATVNVNAQAAKAMQERVLRERATSPDGPVIASGSPNWLWYLGALALLAVVGYAVLTLTR